MKRHYTATIVGIRDGPSVPNSSTTPLSILQIFGAKGIDLISPYKLVYITYFGVRLNFLILYRRHCLFYVLHLFFYIVPLEIMKTKNPTVAQAALR